MSSSEASSALPKKIAVPQGTFGAKALGGKPYGERRGCLFKITVEIDQAAQLTVVDGSVALLT